MIKSKKIRIMEEFWEGVGGCLPDTIGDSRMIKSKEDLLVWLYLDEFWTNYELQEYGYVLDMVMMNEWTMMDIKIFHTIGTHVVINNISHFDKEAVLKIVGCKDTQFRTSIGKLEDAGLIRMLDNNMKKKTERVCKITPAAYWKGNFGVRNMYIENWYQVKLDRVSLDNILLPEGFSK